MLMQEGNIVINYSWYGERVEPVIAACLFVGVQMSAETDARPASL
ncbi:hypothetical protein [Domibacillus tundrae]|nr:hypothetical protein [Domibacillus tundrae]